MRYRPLMMYVLSLCISEIRTDHHIYRFYQTIKNAKRTIDTVPLQHRRALILISPMVLAGSVDSKASALVLVTALAISLSLFLEVHLAAVAVHSVVARGLLGGTIWRLV